MGEVWKTNLIGQDRVSAIIFRGDKLLLIHRIRPEREYWVLIGGSIEDGETHEQALVREVLEECSLEAQEYRFLFTIDNAGRAEHHYLVTLFDGEPILGGPELERHSPDNQYLLTWVSKEELSAIEQFFPEAAKEKILEIWPS